MIARIIAIIFNGTFRSLLFARHEWGAGKGGDFCKKYDPAIDWLDRQNGQIVRRLFQALLIRGENRFEIDFKGGAWIDCNLFCAALI